MAKYDSYVICTSPRSGSTLLCKLLAATGVAGTPESLFYRPSVDDWMARLGIVPEAGETERAGLERVFDAAIRRGRNDTAMFGLRQQPHSFEFLCAQLAGLYPDGPTDAARFERVFGPTLFIHLSRPDKLAQAVSYLKAEQTGLWHVAPDGTELERLAPQRPPVYDSGKIRECVETMTAYDRQWEAWFAGEGIAPFRICYDDLSADPQAILRAVLDRLGLDPAAAGGVEPGVRKLADDTSQDWMTRFRAERAPA